MVEQVSSAFANNNGMGTTTLGGVTTPVTLLPLAGTRAGGTINGQSLTDFAKKSLGPQPMVMNLGNSTTNFPSFQIIGVGNDNVLFSYDLLQAAAPNPLPIADGIFELHALYGIDNDNDGNGVVDTWIDPSTPGYEYATLSNGTLVPAAANIQKIKAIRLGIILRTSLTEKSTTPSTTPGPLTLFSDLGPTLTYTRTLTGDEQNYRYRTLEATIPIRNSLLVVN